MALKNGESRLEEAVRQFTELARHDTSITFPRLHDMERTLDNDPLLLMDFYGSIGIESLSMAEYGSLPKLDLNLVDYIQKKHNIYSHKVHDMLNRDTLTGLGNRRSLEGFLESYDISKGLSVIFVDLDNFKTGINDAYGHDFGDAVLGYAGEALGKFTRDSDLKVRNGGDEFVVCMPEFSAASFSDDVSHDFKSPRDYISHLRTEIMDYVQRRIDEEHPDKKVDFCLSLGMAISDGSCSSDELLKRADLAMYHAKSEAEDSSHMHIYNPAKAGAYRANNH